MIMGIISLIFFIVGLFLYMYNFRNNSDMVNTLGGIIFAVGLGGIITFMVVNAKIIISLFTI